LEPREVLRKVQGHWVAVLLLVARAALGVFYSMAVPAWESFDEPGHYAYVRYIATHHAVPQIGASEINQISEVMQPPLYYVLGALPVLWAKVDDGAQPVPNPFFPSGTGGVNYAIHPDSEAFPYSGTIMALHGVRLLSVAISLAAIAMTYLIGLTIAPARKSLAVGAMAIHAFWPQFLFSGSVVTNDVLATAIGSAIILVMMRTLKTSGSLLQVGTLGLLFGFGLLSKLNTLSLLPVALVLVVAKGVVGIGRGGVRNAFFWCCSTAAGLVSLLIAWGILRRMNYAVVPVLDYGSGPILSRVLSGIGEVLAGLDVPTLRRASMYALNTSFALFGWGNLAVDPVLYDVFALVLVVAAAGLLLFFLRRRQQPARASVGVLLAAFFAVLSLPLLLVAAHGQDVSFAPGRYLLPGISAFCILLFVGCDEISRFRGRSFLPILLIGALACLALLIPFRYIRPAYARPPLLPATDVQDLPHQVSLTFGEDIELLAYQLDTEPLTPGQRTGLALYWRALGKMDQNYTVCVRLLGPSGETDGADCTYPARGNYATSLWRPGDIFRDQYHVRVPKGVAAPSYAQINVAILRYPENEHLWVRGPRDTEAQPSATFGRVKVASSEEVGQGIEHRVSFDLGQAISLVGYDLVGKPSAGDEVTLVLYWSCSAPVDKDYAVFVHLVDSAGQLWAQHDGQPRDNAYPTSLWGAGEIVRDQHQLSLPFDLPAGGYEIHVGMYSADTMLRLPVVDEQGDRQRDDLIVLDRIVVQAQDRR
jgi:hypothetical protein